MRQFIRDLGPWWPAEIASIALFIFTAPFLLSLMMGTQP